MLKLEDIAAAPQKLSGVAAVAALTAMASFSPAVRGAAIAAMFVILKRQTNISTADLMQVADNKVASGITHRVEELRGAALTIHQEIASK